MVIEADDTPMVTPQTARTMTRLIDVHAPRHDVTQTLALHVGATPSAVLRAADRLVADEPAHAVRVLASVQGQRVFGMAWSPRPGASGHVDIVWDLRVEDDGDGGCYLSSTRRFVASDAPTREALLHQWRYVGPSADAIARTTLRAVKRRAEALPALVAHPVEMPLAA